MVWDVCMVSKEVLATVLQDKSILLSGIDVNDSSFEQYIQKHRHLTTDDITILQIQLKGE